MLTSFASKDGPGITGSSQATTKFGAPEVKEDDEKEEEENDEENDDESGMTQEAREERRFQHRESTTILIHDYSSGLKAIPHRLHR